MTDPASQHPIQRAIVRFDADVDRALDHLRGRPLVDRFFYTASELGDFSLLWHLLATAQGVRRRGDLSATLRLVAALGLESTLVNGPVKSIFRRTRPVSDVPRPHRLRAPRTTSFPSGHASAAAIFATVASQDDPLWPLYVALAAAVAVSRPYVRIHHASDVVAGAALGITLGAGFRRWWPAGRSRPLFRLGRVPVGMNQPGGPIQLVTASSGRGLSGASSPRTSRRRSETSLEETSSRLSSATNSSSIRATTESIAVSSSARSRVSVIAHDDTPGRRPRVRRPAS